MRKLSLLFLILFVVGCTSKYEFQKVLITEQELAVNPSVIRALIDIESSGNHLVVHPKSKATGLMQLLPSTARSLGYHPSEMLDPIKNVEAGTKYYHKLKYEYCNGDVHCALRSYYCGPAKRNNSTCYRYADKVLSRAKEFGYVHKPRSSSKGSVKASRHKATASTLKFNEPNYEPIKPFNGYTFAITEKKNDKR